MSDGWKWKFFGNWKYLSSSQDLRLNDSQFFILKPRYSLWTIINYINYKNLKQLTKYWKCRNDALQTLSAPRHKGECRNINLTLFWGLNVQIRDRHLQRSWRSYNWFKLIHNNNMTHIPPPTQYADFLIETWDSGLSRYCWSKNGPIRAKKTLKMGKC